MIHSIIANQAVWHTTGKVLARRPRLLFLARPFPPLRATACVRTWNMTKYLSRLGWDITVVTPHPSIWRYQESVDRIEASLRKEGVHRLLTDYRWRFLSPAQVDYPNQGFRWLAGGICRKVARWLNIDNGIGWMKAAEVACSKLNEEDVDVILATGSPFSSFRLARRLSNRLKKPYVLDYRDPWTGNPHALQSPRQAIVREEASLLKASTAVTIVSPAWRLAMEQRFGIGTKLYVVTNGYDPEELASVQPVNFGHFAIVYAGNFYPPKRTISPLMASLKHLKELIQNKGDRWYFHYYGVQEKHVMEEAQRFNVEERVILHGNVARSEVLAATRGAGLAVIISSTTQTTTAEDNGIVPGKVFEVLGLGTPMLLIAPRGSDVETIIETTGLGQSFVGTDIDGMTTFIRDALHGNTTEPKSPEAYSWANIARKMDFILRTATDENFTSSASINM
jgi:glycosyltransferase involved in cell wall biosynthesis